MTEEFQEYLKQPGLVESIGKVDTCRANRYAKQLANHFAHKIPATWDSESTTGTLIFNREGPITGVATLNTTPDALTITLITQPPYMDQLQGVIARHLEHFGSRDNLAVVWHVAESKP